MIDFEINPDATQIALSRANEHKRRRENLQLCINELVCPICAKDLEKYIDENRNIKRICTSDTCEFVWPQPAEKLKLHVEKNKSKRPSCKEVHGSYSGSGIGAKITLDRFIKWLGN